MPRILGVDIPDNKCVEYSLRYIYGVGPTRSKEIVAHWKCSEVLRARDLTSEQIVEITNYIEQNFLTEGKLRREVASNIKRLVDMNCYRGARHRQGLPVRGQRTSTNARTRKGKRKTVANKKMAVK